MFLSFFLFILGVIVGFGFLAIIASSKQADLWAAVKLAAYKEDSTLCKELIQNNHG